MNDPIIHCSHSALADPQKLVPHPRNPNIHLPDQLDAIVSAIEKVGWRKAIVVSNLSGFIVAGHGACEAAIKAGWKEVPISSQDFEDESEELAYLLADNKLASLSDLHDASVSDILRFLADEDVELDGLGFSEAELAEILKDDDGNLTIEDRPASDDLADVKVTIGEYRATIDRDRYLKWSSDLGLRFEMDQAAIVAEIVERLKL